MKVLVTQDQSSRNTAQARAESPSIPDSYGQKNNLKDMKYTYSASTLPNTRIDIADILRGIAVIGIILIHFIEHMNFYLFPEPKNEFWSVVDSAVWDSIFFLLAGKMYAIFALLFGLSFFIQHDNQAKKGVDFRPRFVWRMVLMMLFGLFDLLFFNGDILFVYAVCGLMVIPLIRASDKLIKAFIIVLTLQPIELIYIVLGLFDPGTAPLNLGSGNYFGALIGAQSQGSFIDVAVQGIRNGLPINFFWAIENGRFTQNIMFFLLGIMMGRKRLFYNEGDNLKRWKKILIASCCATAVLLPLYYTLPGIIETKCISNSVKVALNMWKNFAMMLIYVSGAVLIFYNTSAKAWMIKLAPFGRMSLSNYLGQSIIGGAVFYNWGLGLYRHCGHTVSLLLGIVCVAILFAFSNWWMKHHKRGPFEQLWYSATWIGKK